MAGELIVCINCLILDHIHTDYTLIQKTIQQGQIRNEQEGNRGNIIPQCV